LGEQDVDDMILLNGILQESFGCPR